MMRTIYKIVFILAAAALLAAANYAINPRRPVLPLKDGEVSLADLSGIKALLMIVDARSPEDYAKGHVKGAFNLPEALFESRLGAFLDEWSPDASVLVYCNAGQCNSSRAVAGRLKNECGIQNVFVLKDDWKKWKEQGK